MCSCRLIFLTGASNNHDDSFPFFLSGASAEGGGLAQGLGIRLFAFGLSPLLILTLGRGGGYLTSKPRGGRPRGCTHPGPRGSTSNCKTTKRQALPRTPAVGARGCGNEDGPRAGRRASHCPQVNAPDCEAAPAAGTTLETWTAGALVTFDPFPNLPGTYYLCVTANWDTPQPSGPYFQLLGQASGALPFVISALPTFNFDLNVPVATLPLSVFLDLTSGPVASPTTVCSPCAPCTPPPPLPPTNGQPQSCAQQLSISQGRGRGGMGGGLTPPTPPPLGPPPPMPLSDWANCSSGLRPIQNFFWRLRRKSV